MFSEILKPDYLEVVYQITSFMVQIPPESHNLSKANFFRSVANGSLGQRAGIGDARPISSQGDIYSAAIATGQKPTLTNYGWRWLLVAKSTEPAR